VTEKTRVIPPIELIAEGVVISARTCDWSLEIATSLRSSQH